MKVGNYSAKDLSIIIPFYNEEGNVHFVLDELLTLYPEAEIIAVDDGSTDSTTSILKSNRCVRNIIFPVRCGQGIAVYEGFKASTREICTMLDGDGQNDPKDIATLLSRLGEADYVWGYRLNRSDTTPRKIAGKIANKTRKIFLGNDGVRDVGCSLRAFRRSHLKHLIPFEGLHRFMPVFFKNAGLSVIEVPVSHRRRRAGKSKYSISKRAFRGIRDLVKVRNLIRQ